ncbi:hypothetical protein Fot_14557 [Forsythia ovata]|uniref:Uncharacterized protein n=1 Tax=Forsythia ovata TaxID=205694 RepID=A0ABD1W6M9_9LAMI
MAKIGSYVDEPDMPVLRICRALAIQVVRSTCFCKEVAVVALLKLPQAPLLRSHPLSPASFLPAAQTKSHPRQSYLHGQAVHQTLSLGQNRQAVYQTLGLGQNLHAHLLVLSILHHDPVPFLREVGPSTIRRTCVIESKRIHRGLLYYTDCKTCKYNPQNETYHAYQAELRRP